MSKFSRVQRLRRQGFDLSYSVPFTSTWKVRCSCCEALVVNGVPCHERGCPNAAMARALGFCAGLARSEMGP